VNAAINNNINSKYKPVQLDELLADTEVDIPDDFSKITITDLASDSRNVKHGDLFFAVPGYALDGTKFISEATSLGANAVITQRTDIAIENIPVLKCNDIRKTMSQVADCFFESPSDKLKVIGITGTNGKTTVCFMISHIMKKNNQSWGKIGTIEHFTGARTINALNTTPGSIDVQRYLAEMRDFNMAGCVMEVSSHGLDQRRCDNVRFSGAVFTNLTQDHLDYHKDMDSYFIAKSILFEKLLNADGFAVLNIDDPYYNRLMKLPRGRILTFSAAADSEKSNIADIRIEDDGYKDNTRYFEAIYQGNTIKGSIPLLGIFNLANAGAAITAAIGAGCDFKNAVTALKDAPQIPGRVERVDVGQPFEVIIDYAHTPDALKNLLQGIDTDGKKILMFGCGGDRDKTKRPVMGEIASQYADLLIVTSDNPRTEDPKRIINDILKGIPKKVSFTVNEKRDEAIGQALALAGESDLVIIAGKGHEDYQVVGNTRHYFSDPEVVKKHLRKMGYEGS